MKEIPGLDTMVNLSHEPPQTIAVSFRAQYATSIGQQALWEFSIATIPYCMACKVPVNWIKEDSNLLYRCPVCNRTWIKDSNWTGDIAQLLRNNKSSRRV